MDIMRTFRNSSAPRRELTEREWSVNPEEFRLRIKRRRNVADCWYADLPRTVDISPSYYMVPAYMTIMNIIRIDS